MRLALPTTRLLAAIVAVSLTPVAATAGGLELRVLDRDGEPVPEIAVHARPLSAAGRAGGASSPGPGAGTGSVRMNQRGLAFEPHILIVEAGTVVDFPNSDEVRHHVYSFSPAKAFDFSIEAGSIREDLRFDAPGLVTLGCNVHDDMLGFILVVDTPHFAKTDGDGVVSFSGLEDGHWELVLWTPRVSAKHLPVPIAIEIGAAAAGAGQTLRLEHRFDAKLYPPHQHSDTSLHWSHY